MILYYFLLFYIYSFLGWLMESCYVSILNKKITNRGFLIGPYCPIYGVGSTIMVAYLNQYRDNFFTVFILCVFICSILEYITSYLMEAIFKTRWWDYSKEKFNLNGRVCGKNACLFGLGGLFIIYVANPIIDSIIKSINPKVTVFLLIVLTIIFIIDFICSYMITSKFKKLLTNFEFKDSTQELKKLTREILNNNIANTKVNFNIFQKRIIQAFPNIDLYKLIEDKKERLKKALQKI